MPYQNVKNVTILPLAFLRHGYQVTSEGRPRNKHRTGSRIQTGSRIPPEIEIPAETDEEGSGAARQTTDVAISIYRK